jgi:hypothetical protein
MKINKIKNLADSLVLVIWLIGQTILSILKVRIGKIIKTIKGSAVNNLIYSTIFMDWSLNSGFIYLRIYFNLCFFIQITIFLG